MNLIDKLPVAVIIIAVIAALSFQSSVKKIDEEIAAINKEKILSERSLNRYADIEKYFGRASDEFYSSKPIVILHGNGNSDTIPIYCFKNKKNISAVAVNGMVEGKFDTWNDKRVNLTVTSKTARGYEMVVFKNNATNEEFRVLVVVK